MHRHRRIRRINPQLPPPPPPPLPHPLLLHHLIPQLQLPLLLHHLPLVRRFLFIPHPLVLPPVLLPLQLPPFKAQPCKFQRYMRHPRPTTPYPRPRHRLLIPPDNTPASDISAILERLEDSTCAHLRPRNTPNHSIPWWRGIGSGAPAIDTQQTPKAEENPEFVNEGCEGCEGGGQARGREVGRFGEEGVEEVEGVGCG